MKLGIDGLFGPAFGLQSSALPSLHLTRIKSYDTGMNTEAKMELPLDRAENSESLNSKWLSSPEIFPPISVSSSADKKDSYYQLPFGRERRSGRRQTATVAII